MRCGPGAVGPARAGAPAGQPACAGAVHPVFGGVRGGMRGFPAGDPGRQGRAGPGGVCAPGPGDQRRPERGLRLRPRRAAGAGGPGPAAGLHPRHGGGRRGGARLVRGGQGAGLPFRLGRRHIFAGGGHLLSRHPDLRPGTVLPRAGRRGAGPLRLPERFHGRGLAVLPGAGGCGGAHFVAPVPDP